MITRDSRGHVHTTMALSAGVLAIVLIAVADGATPLSLPETSTGIAGTSMPPRPANATVEVPRRIAIPVLDVYAAVEPVGKDASGGVAVPEDIRLIGWYRWSAPLGSAEGSTVLVGHRDARDEGAGSFYELDTLSSGDRILVSGAGGAATYLVADVAVVDKDEFDERTEDIFSTVGDSRLTLITCGGEFDFDAGSYVSNVIVTAYPER